MIMETKNIKLVAYLRLKGRHPDKVDKISRGKAKYLFEMSQEEWAKLKQDFDRSEFITYAQCYDAVVDLAY